MRFGPEENEFDRLEIEPAARHRVLQVAGPHETLHAALEEFPTEVALDAGLAGEAEGSRLLIVREREFDDPELIEYARERAIAPTYVEPARSLLRHALNPRIAARVAKVSVGAAAILALALVQSWLLWNARHSPVVPGRYAAMEGVALRQPVAQVRAVERRSASEVAVKAMPTPPPTKPAPVRQARAAAPAPPPARPPAAAPPRSAQRAEAPVQPALHVPSPSERPPAAQRAATNDTAAIQSVLRRYGRAYSGLDAGAVSEVWPTVDTKALGRTFDTLETQAVSFDSCDISVTVGAAAASCQGTLRYVKTGSRNPHSERHVWQFSLRKGGQGWVISRVQSR